MAEKKTRKCNLPFYGDVVNIAQVRAVVGQIRKCWPSPAPEWCYTGVGRSQCHCGTASYGSAFGKGKGWILGSLGTKERQVWTELLSPAVSITLPEVSARCFNFH